MRDLTLKSTAPTLVYEEGSLIKRSIRDLYSKDIDEILVAGDDGYHGSARLHAHADAEPCQEREAVPRHAADLHPLRRSRTSSTPCSSRWCSCAPAATSCINQTEALVAIDVNSGRATREHHIEDTALKTNLEAADEIARQLRLRDLAGLIVIDFIDMDEKRNNRTVERRLKEALKHDRARIQVGHISHFGLLEMSRQRIRSSVLESSTEKCPHCGGTGHVRSVSSVSLQLLRSIEEMLLKGATHNIIVRTRTEIALYLLNHKRAHLRALEERFRIAITVNADATIAGQIVLRRSRRASWCTASSRRRRSPRSRSRRCRSPTTRTTSSRRKQTKTSETEAEAEAGETRSDDDDSRRKPRGDRDGGERGRPRTPAPAARTPRRRRRRSARRRLPQDDAPERECSIRSRADDEAAMAAEGESAGEAGAEHDGGPAASATATAMAAAGGAAGAADGAIAAAATATDRGSDRPAQFDGEHGAEGAEHERHQRAVIRAARARGTSDAEARTRPHARGARRARAGAGSLRTAAAATLRRSRLPRSRAGARAAPERAAAAFDRARAARRSSPAATPKLRRRPSAASRSSCRSRWSPAPPRARRPTSRAAPAGGASASLAS